MLSNSATSAYGTGSRVAQLRRRTQIGPSRISLRRAAPRHDISITLPGDVRPGPSAPTMVLGNFLNESVSALTKGNEAQFCSESVSDEPQFVGAVDDSAFHEESELNLFAEPAGSAWDSDHAEKREATEGGQGIHILLPNN